MTGSTLPSSASRGRRPGSGHGFSPSELGQPAPAAADRSEVPPFPTRPAGTERREYVRRPGCSDCRDGTCTREPMPAGQRFHPSELGQRPPKAPSPVTGSPLPGSASGQAPRILEGTHVYLCNLCGREIARQHRSIPPNRELELTLEAHLETHPPREWLEALIEAQGKIRALQRELHDRIYREQHPTDMLAGGST